MYEPTGLSCLSVHIPSPRSLQLYSLTANRYLDSPTGKTRKGQVCALRERNSRHRRTSILWLYDDMLAGVRRSCTYSCLAIIGHEVKRQSVYGRVTSFTSSSDGPCDHWHLAEAQAKALSGTHVCLVKDTDTQPLTRCGAGIGESTLTFWRFAGGI